LNNVYWLKPGFKQYFASFIVEKSGDSLFNSSLTKGWLDALKDLKSLPLLQLLDSEKNWIDAQKKYSGNIINSYSSLAVQFLIEKKGIISLNNYFKFVKEENGSKTFSKAFGFSVSELDNQLEKSLKK
jgi:hypothetical protein